MFQFRNLQNIFYNLSVKKKLFSYKEANDLFLAFKI